MKIVILPATVTQLFVRSDWKKCNQTLLPRIKISHEYSLKIFR